MFGGFNVGRMMAAREAAKNPLPGWCKCPPDKDSGIIDTLQKLGEDIDCVCMKCNHRIKPKTKPKTKVLKKTMMKVKKRKKKP
jgi:hypothetical protein